MSLGLDELTLYANFINFSFYSTMICKDFVFYGSTWTEQVPICWSEICSHILRGLPQNFHIKSTFDINLIKWYLSSMHFCLQRTLLCQLKCSLLRNEKFYLLQSVLYLIIKSMLKHCCKQVSSGFLSCHWVYTHNTFGINSNNRTFPKWRRKYGPVKGQWTFSKRWG